MTMADEAKAPGPDEVWTDEQAHVDALRRFCRRGVGNQSLLSGLLLLSVPGRRGRMQQWGLHWGAGNMLRVFDLEALLRMLRMNNRHGVAERLERAYAMAQLEEPGAPRYEFGSLKARVVSIDFGNMQMISPRDVDYVAQAFVTGRRR
jgi:hypothetical protein